jgi:hypothetical protein
VRWATIFDPRAEVIERGDGGDPDDLLDEVGIL